MVMPLFIMAKHSAFFPPLYTATVRAGEKRGDVVDVLQRFISCQKRMIAVLSKLKMALAYPVFLVVVPVAVLTLFFLYVIPNFTQMYSDQPAWLPWLTTLLISFTTALIRLAPFLLIGAIGAEIEMWKKTERGRLELDGLKLRIPILRSLIRQYLLAQITRTLATVLRGDIPPVQALEATAGVIKNEVMARRLGEARELVVGGESLANSLECTRLAPGMTQRMIEVGESSGDLPLMLEEVVDYYDREVENRLTAIATMIEPVLMLMGLVTAFIVVALYLPIFEMGARLT